MGMVPQDSLLFEGTIAENISLNDPTAEDEDIIDVATIACAHEFIMDLPQGYATMVAERGTNLSGGQRQRLAIGKNVLDNPKLDYGRGNKCTRLRNRKNCMHEYSRMGER